MASRQDLDEAVIKPMIREYPAPGNLRADPAAFQARLERYRRALAGFDLPVLEAGFQLAAERSEIYCWPGIRDLVEACTEIAKRQGGQTEAWVEKATDLADAYTNRFMKTTTAAMRAREGGYEAELKRYVTEAAWVQAQYIVSRQNAGYSSVLFTGPRDKEAEQEFFARARKQAESGHIKVHVPHELVERWKAGVEKGGQSR